MTPINTLFSFAHSTSLLTAGAAFNSMTTGIPAPVASRQMRLDSAHQLRWIIGDQLHHIVGRSRPNLDNSIICHAINETDPPAPETSDSLPRPVSELELESSLIGILLTQTQGVLTLLERQLSSSQRTTVNRKLIELRENHQVYRIGLDRLERFQGRAQPALHRAIDQKLTELNDAIHQLALRPGKRSPFWSTPLLARLQGMLETLSPQILAIDPDLMAHATMVRGGLALLRNQESHWLREWNALTVLPQALRRKHRMGIEAKLLELINRIVRFKDGDVSALQSQHTLEKAIEIERREYQQRMRDGLDRDLQDESLPWLAFASPMQTGKSWMIGDYIRGAQAHYGDDVQIIVLSSSKAITDQMLGDLVEDHGFALQEIGRLDGTVKEVEGRKFTVASIHAMTPDNLAKYFDPNRKTVIINDEAYSTQSNRYRGVYTYFGLGRINERGLMVPKPGNGRVIGLSGTGARLRGYHVSGELLLLDAIEQGWVRDLEGDQLKMEISYERRTVFENLEEDNDAEIVEGDDSTSAQSGRTEMIWWKATEDNARVLAEQYRDQIVKKGYRSTLIYAPTIKHATLLSEAIEKLDLDLPVGLVHSRMTDADVKDAMDHYEQHGGALISVRKLSRGFRGTGTEAVFHTYQTSSAELFAQRSGRAWGNSEEANLPPLYILEATWSQRSNFANLARLLGLIDYPLSRVTTRGLRKRIQKSRKRQELDEELVASVKSGAVQSLLAETPLLIEWRTQMQGIVAQAGGVAALAQETGLAQELVLGIAMGSAPTAWPIMQRFQSYFEGENNAQSLWMRTWEEIVEGLMEETQVLAGKLRESLGPRLMTWHQTQHEDESARRDALDRLLCEFYPLAKIAPSLAKETGGGSRARPTSAASNRKILKGSRAWVIEEVNYRLWGSYREEDITAAIEEYAQAFIESRYSNAQRTLFKARVLPFIPTKTYKDLASELGRSSANAAFRTQLMATYFITYLTRQLEKLPPTVPALERPIRYLGFPGRTLSIIEEHGLDKATARVKDLVALMDEVGTNPEKDAELQSLSQWVIVDIQVKLARLGLIETQQRPPEFLIPIDALDFSVRVTSGLVDLNIRTLGDLAQRTRAELLKSKPIGRLSLNEVEEELAVRGLELGMQIDATNPTAWVRKDHKRVPFILEVEVLAQAVMSLELSVRSANACQRAGIFKIAQLVMQREVDLLKLKNFGRGSLEDVKDALAALDLSLGMDPWLHPGAFSARTADCLERAKIRSIGDLVQRSESDLLKIKNFGRVSLKEVKEVLADLGLSLGM